MTPKELLNDIDCNGIEQWVYIMPDPSEWPKEYEDYYWKISKSLRKHSDVIYEFYNKLEGEVYNVRSDNPS